MSPETPNVGSSFSLTHWLQQPDPLLLPILARHVPATHVQVLTQLSDITGSRGGVSPPWPPLAEQVSRMVAERWREFDPELAHRALVEQPRIARYLTAEELGAIPESTRRASPCVEASIIQASGDSQRARTLADFLLRERGDGDRRGLSLLLAASPTGIEQACLQAVLDDRGEYALEAWLDLAAQGRLTDDILYQIEQSLDELYCPGVTVAALLGPALGERARRLARCFATESPGGIADWYVAALLSRALLAFDGALLGPWAEPLQEPYRDHVRRLVAGTDPGAPDGDPDSLPVLMRAHPAAFEIQRALAALDKDTAAALSADALDLNFDLWAGAGPPPAMAPPPTVGATPPAPPATSAPPALPRRRRSVFGRLVESLVNTVSGAGSGPTGEGEGQPAESRVGMDDPAEETADATRLTVPPERFVQAAVVHDGRQRRSFVAGTRNEILCWIGPEEQDDPRPRATATEPVREDVVPAEGLMLDVVLSFDGTSRTGTVHLPKDRRTSSGRCLLPIDVPADETHVIAEIAFLYKGRIFEMVRLDAPVVAPGEADQGLRLKSLAQGREDIELSDREPVDAAVVSEGQEIKVFGPLGIARYTLASTALAVDWLNKEIFATEKSLVRRQADGASPAGLMADDDETLMFLRRMAQHGNSLYKELRQQGFVDPGERIQLMNLDPRSYVPLEFVYDRGHPVEGARLCEGWQAALAGDDAQCPVCKPASDLGPEERDAMPVICPLGFWSLQKVIERHDVSRDNDRGRVAPVDGADVLPPISSALFGSSFRVLEADREQTAGVLRECVRNAVSVEDWSAWKSVVGQQRPQLFVAMPHHSIKAAIDTLEIGDGQELSQDRLSELYVSASGEGPGPIVVLFGCETQSQSEMGYVSFGRDFARNRAAIVVGTMAKVLGRHAAPVAQCLIREFTGVTERTRVGLLMRRIRRRMLAQGYLMALCLVTLGDGDWWLGGANPAEEEGP